MWVERCKLFVFLYLRLYESFAFSWPEIDLTLNTKISISKLANMFEALRILDLWHVWSASGHLRFCPHLNWTLSVVWIRSCARYLHSDVELRETILRVEKNIFYLDYSFFTLFWFALCSEMIFQQFSKRYK